MVRMASIAARISASRCWANAAKHYDEEQLAALVALIAGINAWNRPNVITQQPTGDYQPGQCG
jgi:alkylhydroperoxidase family enzyme